MRVFLVSNFVGALQPETRNPKPETRNPKPETRNRSGKNHSSFQSAIDQMKTGIYIFIVFLLAWSGCEPDPPAMPEVTAFYPSSDTLPENLLRMYVVFSKPMKTQGNLEKIALYTGKGDEVGGAFLETAEELWSPDQKQWTILLDPGRVKTGLQAHETLGRALVEGERYELVIEGLEDVYHQKMSKRFVKPLHITSADTVAPDMAHWDVQVPSPNTKAPLTIYFPQSLDQFSIRQRLFLTTADTLSVAGRVEIGVQERSWIFTPADRWRKGTYYLHVNTRLADPAGNNLNGLFDHKVGSLKYNQEGVVTRLEVTI